MMIHLLAMGTKSEYEAELERRRGSVELPSRRRGESLVGRITEKVPRLLRRTLGFN